MIGQKHYTIVRPIDDTRVQAWRGSANRHSDPWTFDLARAKSYRRPGDALSAARQIEVDAGTRLEVVELNTVLVRVVSYVETGEIEQ